MERFERFTKEAQDAAARCYEVAERYKDQVVGTEHLFLALMEQPNGAIKQGLTKLNVNSQLIKADLERILGSRWRLPFRSFNSKKVFITPQLKIIVDKSLEEADRLQKPYVSTKHILLAIISEHGTPVSSIIAKHGLTGERVESMVEEDKSSEGQSQS